MNKTEAIGRNIQLILDVLDEQNIIIREGFPPRPFLIALDGRCGAGKTTLAAALKNALESRSPKPVVTLIHMDDFYPRPEQRTEERFRTPGGNVDHERFKAEVLEKLKSNADFSYRPFDCARMALGEPAAVCSSHIAIIEGSCSLHPELREQYDLKLFLDIEPKEQRERILKRNGEAKLKQFIERWIPFEELYFNGCAVRECANIILK